MVQTILIIDDDIDTLKLVGIMLERKGFKILASTSGEKGLQFAKDEIPDLILLDVMIPDFSGYDIARTLRSTPETESIPIIMFTARSQVDDKVEGLEAGADAYITKPARPRELFAQVNSILKRAPHQVSSINTQPIKKGKLFGIISTKGGIGISTLATNLAIELLHQSGKDTILSDFRPGQGTIGMDLDLQNATGMINLLEFYDPEKIGEMISDTVITHKTGIKTLLSSQNPSDSKYIYHVDHFLEITRQLLARAEYTILDLGPSLTPISSAILPECDKILICFDPSPGNIHQTKILIQELNGIGVDEGRFIYVLINRQRSGVQLSMAQAEEELEQKIDQVFTPVPEFAYQAAAIKSPMILRKEDSFTNEQFRDLTKLILE